MAPVLKPSSSKLTSSSPMTVKPMKPKKLATNLFPDSNASKIENGKTIETTRIRKVHQKCLKEKR